MLADSHMYPLFFSKDWFEVRNASALRGYLRYLILHMFLEQLPAEQREGSSSLAQASAEIEEYKTTPEASKWVPACMLCSVRRGHLHRHVSATDCQCGAAIRQ